MTSFYEFSAETIDGQVYSFNELKSKVVLIVNVASQCGFTPQYEGLQKLYEKYHAQGFTILGFPCNQFGSQEPGSESEIKEFCSLKYQVSFPMFKKVNVNGDDAHPLFAFLKKNAKGILGTEMIKWNFTKFLIDKNGKIVDRFAPNTKPEDLSAIIDTLVR